MPTKQATKHVVKPARPRAADPVWRRKPFTLDVRLLYKLPVIYATDEYIEEVLDSLRELGGADILHKRRTTVRVSGDDKAQPAFAYIIQYRVDIKYATMVDVIDKLEELGSVAITHVTVDRRNV